MVKKINLKKDELFNNEGAKYCRKCQCPCCTLNIPPFLTRRDILKISSNEKLQIEDFVEKRTRTDGKIVYYAKRGIDNSNHCIFYNKKMKKCKIYVNRPVDCRLFPLDIIQLKNKYYWINYDICKVSNNISNKIIDYANKMLLPLLKDDIDVYSTEIIPLWDEGKGKIISQITDL